MVWEEVVWVWGLEIVVFFFRNCNCLGLVRLFCGVGISYGYVNGVSCV